MKKIGLIICGLFTLLAVSVKAAPITESDAKSVAEVFCAKKGITGELSLSDVKRENCYIFNSSEDGYVIVAANDNLTPILGYSKTGAIHLEAQKVVAFIGWLNSIDADADSLLAKSDEESIDKANWAQLRSGEVPETTRGAQSVEPLLSTKWYQYEPYNLLCPENSPTGCVAVAMAQIMKYYNYPKRGTGSTKAYLTATNNYSIPSISLDVEYDWDNMLDNYNGEFSKVEADAVSNLLYHCGVTIHTDYDTTASGALIDDVAKALYNYFDYDKSLRIVKREYCTDDQWHELLKGQLDRGYPIIYSGKNEDITKGHAFVCDGYDEDGFYHFNFGWGGYYDGYFSVDFIVPINDSINGQIDDYSFDHKVLVDIFPNENGSFYYDFVFKQPDYFKITKDTVSSRLGYLEIGARYTNLGLEKFEGVLFAEMLDSNGSSIGVIYEDTLSISGSVTQQSVRYIALGDVPNGVYYITFKARDYDGNVYNIRDLYDSTAVRKIVVDLSQDSPNSKLVYEWPDDFTASPSVVCVEDSVSVDGCLTNVSENIVSGMLYLKIANEAGDILSVLEGDLIELAPWGSYCFQWKFNLENVAVGTYFVEVILREGDGNEYNVVDGNDTTSTRSFVVVESSQTNDSFVFRQMDDFFVAVDSLSQEYEIFIDSKIYNQSENDFNGALLIDVFDNRDQVIASLQALDLTIDAFGDVDADLKVALKGFPSGSYYLVLKLSDENGGIYKINDFDGTIARRSFVLPESALEILSSAEDNSLKIYVDEDNSLNLYSAEKQIVVIYDLQGRVIKTISVEGSVHTDLKSGCYLIKSKNSAIKVVL